MALPEICFNLNFTLTTLSKAQQRQGKPSIFNTVTITLNWDLFSKEVLFCEESVKFDMCVGIVTVPPFNKDSTFKDGNVPTS